MSMKKIACALLCALFLVTAVIPAVADNRPYWHGDATVTISGIGVSSYFEDTVSGTNITGEVTLTYLADPSNHLPSSDYTTKVCFKVTDFNGDTYYVYPQYQVGMYGCFTTTKSDAGVPNGVSISTVRFNSYVNGTLRKSITLPN